MKEEPEYVGAHPLCFENLKNHFTQDLGTHQGLTGIKGTINGVKYRAHYLDNKQKFIEINRVKDGPQKNYVNLSKEELREVQQQKNKVKDEGWKFHVSINKEQLPQAWDIIMDVMSKHNVNQFKIANPNHPTAWDEEAESGRSITIYAFKNPDKEFVSGNQQTNNNNDDLDVDIQSMIENDNPSWDVIVKEITERLAQNNIEPGPRATGCSGGGTNEREIPGSNYVTYRHDDRKKRLKPNDDLIPGFSNGDGPSKIVLQGIDQPPRPVTTHDNAPIVIDEEDLHSSIYTQSVMRIKSFDNLNKSTLHEQNTQTNSISINNNNTNNSQTNNQWLQTKSNNNDENNTTNLTIGNTKHKKLKMSQHVQDDPDKNNQKNNNNKKDDPDNKYNQNNTQTTQTTTFTIGMRKQN